MPQSAIKAAITCAEQRGDGRVVMLSHKSIRQWPIVAAGLLQVMAGQSQPSIAGFALRITLREAC